MDKKIELRQIILATDGESNVGVNPVDVAKEAYKKGITVSTIGIIEGKEKESPMVEAHNIAEAGGGICELTDIKDFSRTMEMVTQRSVYKTIEQAVNKELKNILGTKLNDTPPDTRNEIINIIDKYGEESILKCCVLIDCSGSMSKKINIAKNSVLNLLKVLKSRKGKAEIAVMGYSGDLEDSPNMLCDFTENIVELEKGLQKITIGGTTPTGPALNWAIKMIIKEKEKKNEGILESNIV